MKSQPILKPRDQSTIALHPRPAAEASAKIEVYTIGKAICLRAEKNVDGELLHQLVLRLDFGQANRLASLLVQAVEDVRER